MMSVTLLSLLRRQWKNEK